MTTKLYKIVLNLTYFSQAGESDHIFVINGSGIFSVEENTPVEHLGCMRPQKQSSPNDLFFFCKDMDEYDIFYFTPKQRQRQADTEFPCNVSCP